MSNNLEKNYLATSHVEKIDKACNTDFVLMDQRQQLNYIYKHGKRNVKISRKNKLQVKLRRMIKKNKGKMKRNIKIPDCNFVSDVTFVQVSKCDRSSKREFVYMLHDSFPVSKTTVSSINSTHFEVRDQRNETSKSSDSPTVEYDKTNIPDLNLDSNEIPFIELMKDGPTEISTVTSVEEENITSSHKYLHGGNFELPSKKADLDASKSPGHSVLEVSSVIRDTSCNLSCLDKMEKNHSSCDNIKKMSSSDESLKEKAFSDSYFQHAESRYVTNEENCRINGIRKGAIGQQWNNSHEDGKKDKERISRRNAMKGKLRKVIRRNKKKPRMHKLTAYFNLITDCKVPSHKGSSAELPSGTAQDNEKCELPNMRSSGDCINLIGLDMKNQLTEGNMGDCPDKNCSATLLGEKKDDIDSIHSDKEVQNITYSSVDKMKKIPRNNMKTKIVRKNIKKVKIKIKRKCSKPILKCKVSSCQADSIECHTRNVTKKHKETFRCEICKAIFKSKETCNRHELKHSQFSCEACGKQFHFKSLLEQHERLLHTEERPFTCKVCEMCFKEKGSLRKHRSTVHAREKRFTCSKCGKKFSRNDHLTIHKRLHSNDLPFSCDTCGKRFNERCQLKYHVRIHTGEKLIVHTFFPCTMCEKKFPSIPRLKNHVRVHTGEKPYSCDICGTCFKESTGLNRHLKTHTEEKPFSCFECGRKFQRKSYLTAHTAARHTGEKPFICSKCGKKFAIKSYLTNHSKLNCIERKPK